MAIHAGSIIEQRPQSGGRGFGGEEVASSGIERGELRGIQSHDGRPESRCRHRRRLNRPLGLTATLLTTTLLAATLLTTCRRWGSLGRSTRSTRRRPDLGQKATRCTQSESYRQKDRFHVHDRNAFLKC